MLKNNSTFLGMSTDDCGMLSVNDRELINECSYWLEGILLTFFGIFGIIGNIISVIILSRQSTSSSFNSLLIALEAFDTIFILFTIMDYSLARVFAWPWKHDSVVWLYLIPRFSYPLNNTSYCCSIFVTVAIAWERYLAVCHPNHYRTMTLTYSTKLRVFWYLVPVVLLSVLLNVPKFLETEYYYTSTKEETNATNLLLVLNEQNASNLLSAEDWSFLVNFTMVHDDPKETVNNTLAVRLTSLRNNPTYVKYYTFLTRMVITGLIPFTALVFFKRATHQRVNQRQPATQTANRRQQQMQSDINLAFVLVVIVGFFLLFNIPRMLLNMFEFIHMSTMIKCGNNLISPAWFQCLTGFNHLMLVMNASTNVLIYCSFNSEFKTMLKSGITSFYRKIKGPSRRIDNVEMNLLPTPPRQSRVLRASRASRGSRGQRTAQLEVSPPPPPPPSALSEYTTFSSNSNCNIPSRRVSLPIEYTTQRLDLLDTPCLSEGDLSSPSLSRRYRLSPPTLIVESVFQTSSDSWDKPDTPTRSRLTVSTMVNDKATPLIFLEDTVLPFDIQVRSSIPEWL
ncbi:FMRFamide receptor [Eurytemora carolleeae]|uniref:FMRFamide receptor n=1 Tax=Eurytemora carolleeae TaxID=1294199 RepID=UPI000C78FB21|nr:FMRFamide receptor [Eurytemora carolleeae]|eukprot:XP_023345153.1 FMRFamide receptor-like [Eurytemora affinis]